MHFHIFMTIKLYELYELYMERGDVAQSRQLD